MSQKYSGGFITKSPVAPTSSAASGIWTLDQQQQAQQAGNWPSPPIFIEDVFSTYLYTGNDSTQNIVNGIDLAGKGGLVWLKGRSVATGHYLYDTVRGIANGPLSSQNTNEAYTANTPKTLTTFNSDGFSMQDDSATFGTNVSPRTYVSWTFREQPKFFDVVTYTGNSTNRTIAHNLGAVPGCIIVKRTDTAADWAVYHRSLANTQYLVLNTTAAAATGATWWNSTTPTSSVFSVGTDASVNASGGTYVAYLFAHDAGGFPVSGGGSTNGISCGTYTTDGSGNATVNLGYEPQYLTFKATNNVENWGTFDIARGWSVAGNTGNIRPNLSNAEYAGSQYGYPTATGFNVVGLSSSITYIYIAIRRGPMKVPTDATKVLATVTRSGTGATAIITGASSPPDLVVVKSRSNAEYFAFTDRLRGVTKQLSSSYYFSETDYGANPTVSINMDGWTAPGGYGTFNQSGYTYVDYLFSRYPNVFDEVCYTGNSVTPRTITHNLTVAPELIMVKSRSNSQGWAVYASAIGNNKYLILNDVVPAQTDATMWVNTAPTSSVFTVGNPFDVNNTAYTYVAYLFATCAGVSKVGSYTGNGTTQTINCGFTGGARFVLIKRTDANANWYVYDTARGMTVLTDPYFLFNDALAETATLGSVTTVATGFALNSAILAAINVSAGTYIFLAIA